MALGSTDLAGLYMEKVDYKLLPASKLEYPPYYEVQEAARAGLESAQRLIQIASQQPQQDHGQITPQKVVSSCSSVADDALTNLKKMMSLLGRKGHARVRWSPSKARHNANSSLQHTLPAASQVMVPSAPFTHNYSSSEAKYMIPQESQEQKSVAGMCNRSNEYYQQFLALQLQRPQQQPDFRSNHHPYLKLESSLAGSPTASTKSCSLTASKSVLSSPSIDYRVADNKLSLRQPIICAAQEAGSQACSKTKCCGKCDDLGIKCGSAGKCVCTKRRYFLVFLWERNILSVSLRVVHFVFFGRFVIKPRFRLNAFLTRPHSPFIFTFYPCFCLVAVSLTFNAKTVSLTFVMICYFLNAIML